MKKILFMLLFATGGPAALWAQEKIIELKADSVALKIGKVPFNQVVVLDSRFDTTKVGMAQVGGFNKLVKARFDEPASIAIQQYIQNTISQFPKEQEQLLINIKKLMTFEKTSSFSERGYLEFSADTYIQKKDSLYTKVFSIDTVYVIKALDVTKAVFRKIPEALDFMIIQVSNSDFKSTDTSNLRSYHEISTGVRKKWAQLPINSSPHYVKGVYKTFDDFRNNRIDSTAYVVEVVNDSTYGVYAANKDNLSDKKHPAKNIWGINNGKQPYMLVEKVFVPLEGKNNTFYCTANITDTQKKTNAAAVGGASFGILGALLASSFAGDRKSEFYLDMDNGKMMEYRTIER